MAIITKPTTFLIFFQNATTSGNSTSYSFLFPKGIACVKFWGVWGGASVSFETISSLNSNYWIPIGTGDGDALIFTKDGQATLENVVYGDLIRCVISGATGTTSLNVTAQIL